MFAKNFVVELETWRIEDGKGIDDLLAAGKQPEIVAGEEAVRAAVGEILEAASAADPPPKSNDSASPKPENRTVVLVTTDEHVVVAEVTAALAEAEELFQRGGMLVRPAMIEQEARPHLPLPGRSLQPIYPTGLVVLRPAEVPHVRLRITARCALASEGKKGTEPISPPSWLAPAVLACPGPIHGVGGILPGPTLDGDGRLIRLAGYDPPTRWYLGRGLPDLAVAETPTRADAQSAAEAIRELVQDFPWQDPSDLSRWLCLLLTATCRHLIDRTPLGLITANAAGSGKTYLARLISIIAHGLDTPILMSWPAGTEFMARGDEIRKRLASLLQESASLVLIDNLPRGEDFGGPELDGFLTADAYHDRELGKNNGSRVGGLNRLLLLATGNRVMPVGDTADRTLVVRLLCNDPNPRARPPETFQIRDLEYHAFAERPRYLGAVLTIWRAWIQAGCPLPAGPHWGTFDTWVRSVVAITRWLGWPDPLGNRLRQMGESDRERQSLATLTSLWCSVIGTDPLTASQIIAQLDGDRPNANQNALREALAQLGAGSRWPVTATKLGKVLAGHRGATVEAESCGVAVRMQLDGEEDKRLKVFRWFVRRLAGDAGVAGMIRYRPARRRTHVRARTRE